MDFIYDALNYLSTVGHDVSDFFAGIPTFIVDMFAYIWFWAIKFYLSFKIGMVELAYSVAGMLLQDYEVYTVLNAAFNNLSPNLRAACYQLGIVEAIRIVIDAMATAFVLRIMGW